MHFDFIIKFNGCRFHTKVKAKHLNRWPHQNYHGVKFLAGGPFMVRELCSLMFCLVLRFRLKTKFGYKSNSYWYLSDI